MARNRKSQSAAIRFGPALKAFLLCLLIGGSGVGYVWQKEQIVRLGQQMKQREVQLAHLQAQNQKVSRQLDLMLSPRFLEKQIQDLKLGLVRPQPGQVWQLSEPPVKPARNNAEGELAAHAPGASPLP